MGPLVHKIKTGEGAGSRRDCDGNNMGTEEVKKNAPPVLEGAAMLAWQMRCECAQCMYSTVTVAEEGSRNATWNFLSTMH